MHVDLDETSTIPEDENVFCSTVCIVGGGIAGLTLATRLAERGINVHLLEAGGLEQEERSQAFYATEQAGDTHRGATDGRYRTFGGSSTKWGGQLLPFTRDIFSPPTGSPSRAWPISEDDLSPYYEKVQQLFGVDPLPFDSTLLPALGHPPSPFSPEITLRYSKWAPFAKRNVAHTLGPIAIASKSITVFTHANVAEFEASDGDPSEICSVRVLNYARRVFRFKARYFVVAAGTIESARILLCSPGIRDPHDQTGRYFHDHLSFHAGRFSSPAREAMLERLGPFFVDGTLHTCKLEASADARGRQGLLAAMAHVIVIEPEDSGTAAIRNLLRSLQSGEVKRAIALNLMPMLRGAGDVFRLIVAAKFRRRRAVSKRAEVWLNIDVEQSADAENRIRLSPQRDALGLPIVIVEWRVNEAEQQTALQFGRSLRVELEGLGIAPSTWDNALVNGTSPEMLDTYHAMGGLCMGTDASASVVDRELRVHAVRNLYVASCAVFPSGSSSNPTFTMVALTFRLADHLAGLLEGKSVA